MADNYLEKRYDEVFGQKTKLKRVGHTLDELLLKNRSHRGYLKDFVVTREMLERIVSVNTKIPSWCNQQALRFKLVTKGEEADKVLSLVKMGAALPELHLPLAGTEPEAFVICCTTIPEFRGVDIDLGISLQSMCLKAVEMGLNGLIIGNYNRQQLQEALYLPYAPVAVLAIGKGIENITLVPIDSSDTRPVKETHAYYRQDGIHYVPKVQLKDLII